MTFAFHPRDISDLPVAFEDGTRGKVCALSACGMSVETADPLPVGLSVSFELRPPGSAFRFVAEGVVVAVQQREAASRASVRFTLLRLHPAS